MRNDFMELIPNCEISQHALDRIRKHSQLLRNRGINENVIMNAIRSVCNNPGFYDREEPGNNKRYICFNIPQGFYLIIVFTIVQSIVRIITVILTDKSRDTLKKCGLSHNLPS